MKYITIRFINPLWWIRLKINNRITSVLKRKLGTDIVSYMGKYQPMSLEYKKFRKNIWDIVYPTERHMGLVIVLGYLWRFEYAENQS